MKIFTLLQRITTGYRPSILHCVALALIWLSSVWLYAKFSEASLVRKKSQSNSMTFEVPWTRLLIATNRGMAEVNR